MLPILNEPALILGSASDSGGISSRYISVSTITLSFVAGGVRFNSPVLIIDGRVEKLITKWLAAQAREGVSPASLARYAVAVKLFAQYFFLYRGTTTADELYRNFLTALHDGHGELGWEKRQKKTARNYSGVINQICDWLVLDGGRTPSLHPNPVTEVQMTYGERMAAAERNRNRDMLHHLHYLTAEGKGLRNERAIKLRTTRHERRRRKGSSKGGDPTKATAGHQPNGMPLGDYWQLINCETNARNRALWLLLGAGAARCSEALQVYASDIKWDESSNEALVALALPVEGMVTDAKTGKKMTRVRFLAEKYHLSPRCLLAASDPLYAGWKGIDVEGFDDKDRPQMREWREDLWVRVEWLENTFGRLFWNAHVVYMAVRASLRTPHPYYFVNLDRNRGAPLTRSNVTQVLASACRKAGIKPRRPHALRHMFGNTLADWGIPMEDARIMLRHASIESTAVYFRATRGAVRARLGKAARLSLQDRLQLQAARFNSLKLPPAPHLLLKQP